MITRALTPARGFSRTLNRGARVGVADHAWWRDHTGVLVCSSLEDAKAPDGSGDIIPQWHLSVSNSARASRPTPVELQKVVECFELDQFEIDNHHPGIAQHLWIPVDPDRRVDCECKADETIHVEPDGYTWTNPVDGPCRGCEYERLHNRPCPIHTGDAA